MRKITVAQEHFFSIATECLMSRLVPAQVAVQSHAPRAVVCCVGREMHALGARMVSDLLTIGGWDMYECGANTPHDAVKQAITSRRADLLAISVTLSCHLHLVQEVVEQLRRAHEYSGLYIMVGGRPFIVDPTLWKKVGAHGTANDACSAAALANEWCPH